MKKKNEIAVVQNDQPSLGKIAENENFLKDRKALESQIKRAMLQAENPEYHQRLLDLNPQDYAELSNVKWLFNHDRLRSEMELDSLYVAANYYPQSKKKKTFGHSLFAIFILTLCISMSLVAIGFKATEGGNTLSDNPYTDIVVRPIRLLATIIYIPQKAAETTNERKLCRFYKMCGVTIYGEEQHLPKELSNSPIIERGSLGWHIIVRLICLLSLPQSIIILPFFLLLLPLIGTFHSLMLAAYPLCFNIVLSAFTAFPLWLSSKIKDKENTFALGLIKDLQARDVNFEDKSIKNILIPFLEGYCEKNWLEPQKHSKTELVTDCVAITFLRLISASSLIFMFYLWLFHNW